MQPKMLGTKSVRSYGRRRPLPALEPRSQPKPQWVKDAVIELKARHPDYGCRTVAHLFNRQFAATRGARVGKTFVHALCNRHAYDIEVRRRTLKHRRPRPMPRNATWGVDLTGKQDTCGKLHSILGVIDHGTRLNLSLKRLADKSSITLLRCLLDAIEQFGAPKVIRTDNEAVFCSRLFVFALHTLGIRHQRTQPAHPWQNGRIERFFGTLKQKLDQWCVENAEQLSTSLQQFRCWYNHVRPHDYLDGRTPAETWCGIDPFVQAPKSSREFQAWDGLLTGVSLRR
jgi:transposase InsO family protein